MNPLNAILFFIYLTAFICCDGQHQATENKSEGIANTGQAVSAMDKSIWVIFQDSRNKYWFGSNGSGVYCYDGKDLRQFTTKDGLPVNQIRGIQEDKSGNILFDTPKGVARFDGRKLTTLKPVRSTASQWKLIPDDLWFKGNGDITGAYRYDGDTLFDLQFSDLNQKEFNADYGVYSIYKDKYGNIWFGTLSAGVARYDGVSLNWLYEKELSVLKDGRVPAVRSILEDKEGFFWLSNILHKYNILRNDLKGQKTITYDKQEGIEATKQQVYMTLPYYTSAIIDNESSALWMTNYNEGVWKYDGKNLTQYRIKDGETDVLIVSVYKDKQGKLWLATDNAGVYIFNGKAFEKFRL